MSKAELKIAKQRLRALQLAEALGSVSEVCRRLGISRTQFYKYGRRFQTHGLEGLKDLLLIHKSHPQPTAPEVVEKILDQSLENPMWGCVRLSDQLKLTGISVSSPAIQKTLIANDLDSKYQQLHQLEEKALNEKIEPAEEQIQDIRKANPSFKGRHVESSRPGELLSQDTFYVGHLKDVGKVYLQAVVDTYGGYAFAYLHTGKLPEHAAAVIQNKVLPQYEQWELTVSAILTDNGREYCGKDQHAFELYLALNDIEHRTTKVKSPQANGFVERFNRTILDEFLRPSLRQKLYPSVEALQVDLDVWVKHYNEERTHRSYRNMGKRPIDMVLQYLEAGKKGG